jgi:hypothetical protein
MRSAACTTSGFNLPIKGFFGFREILRGWTEPSARQDAPAHDAYQEQGSTQRTPASIAGIRKDDTDGAKEPKAKGDDVCVYVWRGRGLT